MTFVKSSTAAALLSSATLAPPPPPPVDGSQTRIGPPAEQLTQRERAGADRGDGPAAAGVALAEEGQGQDDEEGDSLRGAAGNVLTVVGIVAGVEARAGAAQHGEDPLALSQLPMALPRFTKREQHSAAYYTIGRPPRPRVWS